MEDILKEISTLAIESGDLTFSDKQIQSKWIGNIPATIDEIKLSENRLGIDFPDDYKSFLLITNGFSAPNDIEPTFERIEKVDYLKNIDSFLIEVWSNPFLIDIGKQLAESILIAGVNEEQYFLLIPPSSDNENWKYWKFASWYPGEHSYNDLNHYFIDVLDFIKKNI